MKPPRLEDLQVHVPWGAMIVSTILASQLVTAAFLGLCAWMQGGCVLTTSAVVAGMF